MKSKHRYCTYCGEQLIESEQPNERYGYAAYDEETGKKLYKKVYKCPNIMQKVYFLGKVIREVPDYRHDNYGIGLPYSLEAKNEK